MESQSTADGVLAEHPSTASVLAAHYTELTEKGVPEQVAAHLTAIAAEKLDDLVVALNGGSK